MSKRIATTYNKLYCTVNLQQIVQQVCKRRRPVIRHSIRHIRSVLTCQDAVSLLHDLSFNESSQQIEAVEFEPIAGGGSHRRTWKLDGGGGSGQWPVFTVRRSHIVAGAGTVTTRAGPRARHSSVHRHR